MKISRLMEKLEDISHKHGDVYVVIEHPDGWIDEPMVDYDGDDVVIGFA